MSRFYIENGEILDCGFFLGSKEQYVDIMNKQDQRIAELEQDLEFTTKTANDLIEIKHKLEQELAELKEKAIVPKFKIGQKLFRINYDYESNEYDVSEFNISNYVIFYNDKLWGYPKGYLLDDEDLFATKEEAEKKLQELRGGE